MADQFQASTFSAILSGSGSLDLSVQATQFFVAELPGTGQTTITGDHTPLRSLHSASAVGYYPLLGLSQNATTA